MPIEVLDPTYDHPTDSDAAPLAGVERPPSLEGLTVGLLSNGKQGTVGFFDAFAHVLRQEYGVADVVRVTKGNYSAPAEDEIIDQAREWHALVAGIGD